jgi:hypothetical protein
MAGARASMICFLPLLLANPFLTLLLANANQLVQRVVKGSPSDHPLPEGWKKLYSRTKDREYYQNVNNGKSQWYPPAKDAQQQEQEQEQEQEQKQKEQEQALKPLQEQHTLLMVQVMLLSH